MYQLNPYFTNDGSVGLFSFEDDDIYHSTYGALSESWEKFILPAHLEEYLQSHTKVKILDICYGIGYNSKTALNIFIKQFFKRNKKLFKIKKKFALVSDNNAAIYTNNGKPINDHKKNFIKYQKNKNYLSNFACFFFPKNNCNSPIHVDNISRSEVQPIALKKESQRENSNKKVISKKSCSGILIDAVDLDKTLINISPFIVNEKSGWFNLFLKKKDYNNYLKENSIKFRQINNLKKNMTKLNKSYKLKQETSIILLKKILEQNPTLFNDKNLNNILSNKKYSPFFNSYMINLFRFYQNSCLNLPKRKNKGPFLHNIYYKYISNSNKRALELLKSSEININFYKKDARIFIQSTKEQYNFIFLDAFTPAKAPALWTVQFFKELYSRLEDDGMILTYSKSAAIRNAFLLNGFYVGKTFDKKLNKFMGTVAVKNKSLIEYELNEFDLRLINSKAGICFQDEKLLSDNLTIIKKREQELEKSDLPSSSKIMKGCKKRYEKLL
jgi:tRNA U34 5-methylaminomethyl-2-thiouridine-forming methyltransferase MnmC